MSIVEPNASLPNNSAESMAAVTCTHCGLPVPAGLIAHESIEQFCCAGCRTAFQLIHANGLDAYYSMAEAVDNNPWGNSQAIGSHQDFAEFDQPSFLARFEENKRDGDEVNKISLLLDGIHCAACIWLIEKLPQIVPGVLDVKLNWARQTAQIRWQQNVVPLSKIARTLQQLGYTPHPIRQSKNEIRRRRENRSYLIRIGVAAAAAGNNMLIAASLYLGMFSYMSLGMHQLLRIASCVIGMAALLGPGRIFLQGAINAIRTRTPHMDLPIALGLTVGSIAGVANTIRGTGEIYFDSLSVLIFLLLVGRWIQFRQQNRAADSVEMLYRLTPKTTRKIVDGRVVETFVDMVQTDDLLEIRPGDLIPVDGVIVEGNSEIDESILTGESQLQPKATGDQVLAGTQNQRSVLLVQATATGRKTRLSGIVDLVEQASLDKPEIVQWANRIGGYFVMAVILFAGLTLVGWLFFDPGLAVDRSVALLIVACPCALALATPLAISVALGRAAKTKIMVKGGDVLQRLNRPGMIWLDKTGTLTEGKMEVVRWIGDTRWRPIVAAVESKSSHPVAAALVEHAFDEGDELWPLEFENVQEENGSGISCKLHGRNLLVGNAKLLLAHDVEIARRHQRIADCILRDNLSPCWIAVGGNVVSIVALGDQIRPGTRSAIEQLKAKGWEVGILSGDHEAIVHQVAGRLGIDRRFALGGRSPEEKVDTVRDSFGDWSTVVMVGDGVNDSAALAAASVGIAVHNGAEASLAAAPVYLAEEGLQPILKLLQISNSTNSTIRKNFVASIGYNAFGATFAAIGWINPLVAAILMPISSLTVVAISLTAGKNK